MPTVITRQTKITGCLESSAVRYAAGHLLRDIQALCLPCNLAGAPVVLERNAAIAEERYRIRVAEDALIVQAGDDLGFVYGLYAVSRHVLGVTDLWFWNDQPFTPRESYPLAQGFAIESDPCAVRYRGWFLNDEVLLHTWYVDGSKDLPWEMAFEALLRLGGNMVIPGTDHNAHRYQTLAGDMGLYITHHHAEPLGAPMFARRYPTLTPSYAEHPVLYENLWQEGIDSQKDQKVIWNLGFRGQGDRPFWEDDPQYAAPEVRGKLIGELIQKQYTMVHNACPSATCCTNLYGEILELYLQGHISLPEDIIKVWADNGYGKMVSRRQGNHNPRLRSLPDAQGGGRHGLYYHVSFYDLQAANHITMMQNPPSFVHKELTEALQLGANGYWIINCSNIKPHVFYLDFIASLWKIGSANPKAQTEDYAARYYGAENAQAVSACFGSYFLHAVRYGRYEDESAGDQFFNYPIRVLVSQVIKDSSRAAEALRWATNADTLRSQTEHMLTICNQGVAGYTEHAALCEQAMRNMQGAAGKLFRFSLLMQAIILKLCSQGAAFACQSILKALDGEDQMAFYLAGKSKQAYLQANATMRDSEQGKWQGFYQNDCLTDIKHSAWLMECLMGVLRNNGDGPYFYGWQREFLYAPEDACVMLITNMENHMDNDALFALMEERSNDGNA